MCTCVYTHRKQSTRIQYEYIVSRGFYTVRRARYLERAHISWLIFGGNRSSRSNTAVCGDRCVGRRALARRFIDTLHVYIYRNDHIWPRNVRISYELYALSKVQRKKKKNGINSRNQSVTSRTHFVFLTSTK